MLKLIVNTMLSMLILLSSTGFTVNMHFCHENLIDIAVMAPAESCCGASSEEGLSCHATVESKCSHCKDESLSIETSEDYISSLNVFSFENEFQLELPWLSNISLDLEVSNQNNFLALLDFRKPPTNCEVVLSEIQTFLL